MLRQFGYASSLFQSAEAFAEQTDFDEAVCVLLDINLGDGSGIELRHRLKEAGNTVPVIYMTGNDSSAVRSVWVPRLSHQAVLGHVANRAAQASLGFMTHVPARAGCPLSRGDRKTSTSGEHFRVWHKTDMSLQSPHVGCWGMNGRRSDFA
jgi:CheY-like chemotaxis protein